jgi:hypothetical protein
MMTRLKTFSFRVNSIERRMIKELAKKLQRSQSDAIRFVVVNAARELVAQEETDTQLLTKKEL